MDHIPLQHKQPPLTQAPSHLAAVRRNTAMAARWHTTADINTGWAAAVAAAAAAGVIRGTFSAAHYNTRPSPALISITG